MSDMDQQRTVSPKRLLASLKHCVKTKRPGMLWGPPGIGKSDIIRQLCEEMGGKLYDMRLGQVEQTDLRGMPFYNKETNTMDWAPPIDLPSEEEAAKYPIVFLFLDEINTAAPSVQGAAYQLILDGKVGTYTLPDNVVIFAAGNHESDRGVTYRMPTPLANRFTHFFVKPNHEDWEQWALKNKIHPDVIGFLGFSKNSLFDFDPKSNEKAFATPRTWHFASDFLYEECDDTTTTDLIAGTIGQGLALKFMAHRKVSSKLPNPAKIIRGEITDLDTDDISAMYSLSTSCVYEIANEYDKMKEDEGNDTWMEYVDNIIEYSSKNFTTEIVVMCLRTLFKQYNLPINPSKLKNFKEFNAKYGKLILGAVNG